MPLLPLVLCGLSSLLARFAMYCRRAPASRPGLARAPAGRPPRSGRQRGQMACQAGLGAGGPRSPALCVPGDRRRTRVPDAARAWAGGQRGGSVPPHPSPVAALRCRSNGLLLAGLCAADRDAVEGFPWPGRPRGWAQLGGRSPGLPLAAAVCRPWKATHGNLRCVAFKAENRSGQTQARGAAPERAHPRGLPGHGKPSTASRSAAHSPASKRPFDLQRSAATGEGRGGTLPPRCPPAHARAASGTAVRRLVRPLPVAGGQTAVAVLLVRAARPGLDAGALRHYIPNACKEGGKDRRGPVAGAAKPLTSRSGSDPQSPLEGVEGWQEAVARAERSGAGAFPLCPLGGGSR